MPGKGVACPATDPASALAGGEHVAERGVVVIEAKSVAFDVRGPAGPSSCVRETLQAQGENQAHLSRESAFQQDFRGNTRYKKIDSRIPMGIIIQ